VYLSERLNEVLNRPLSVFLDEVVVA